MTSAVRNTSDLRKLLLESIDGVRNGKVDHRQAQAISALSSRILQSARLDLDVMKMAAGAVAPPAGTGAPARDAGGTRGGRGGPRGGQASPATP